METWSEVKISALAPGFRIDAEFYRPEFLARASDLFHLPCLSLERLAYVTDGEHGSVPYTESGVRYLTAENVRHGYVDITDVRHVDDWVNRRNARAMVEPGNILISIKGTLGQVAVAEQWLPPANMNRDVAVIKIHSQQLKSEFLAAFLMSRFGQFQALREGSGGVQQMITLGRLRSIKVPLLDREAQEHIGSLWQGAATKRNSANSLYATAAQIMEDEFDIDRINLDESINYAARVSELADKRRWDSEFYKPKYRYVLDTVLKSTKVRVRKFIPLRGVLSYITNGHTPLRHDLGSGNVFFLTAEHVCDFRVDFRTNKRILQLHHDTELARTALREGDILVTIKGKVGNCAVVRNCRQAANINQDVALIRLRDGVHPYFFAAWFNSVMGKQLVEQRSTGGINPFLGLGNLRGLPFPLIDEKEQQMIGGLVQETVEKAHSAEQEAANLLGSAKRRTEELIEQGAASKI